MEAKTLRLRVICLDCPLNRSGSATEFGAQMKSGVLHVGEPIDDTTRRFDLMVDIVPSESASGVRIRGPFVHGTSEAPFLYLSLRAVDAPAKAWIKRLKISLVGIDREAVEVAASAGGYLTAIVSGHGAATVPLLNGGWTLEPNSPTS